jgi:hypothetical protein
MPRWCDSWTFSNVAEMRCGTRSAYTLLVEEGFNLLALWHAVVLAVTPAGVVDLDNVSGQAPAGSRSADDERGL